MARRHSYTHKTHRPKTETVVVPVAPKVYPIKAYRIVDGGKEYLYWLDNLNVWHGKNGQLPKPVTYDTEFTSALAKKIVADAVKVSGVMLYKIKNGNKSVSDAEEFVK